MRHLTRRCARWLLSAWSAPGGWPRLCGHNAPGRLTPAYSAALMNTGSPRPATHPRHCHRFGEAGGPLQPWKAALVPQPRHSPDGQVVTQHVDEKIHFRAKRSFGWRDAEDSKAKQSPAWRRRGNDNSPNSHGESKNKGRNVRRMDAAAPVRKPVAAPVLTP